MVHWFVLVQADISTSILCIGGGGEGQGAEKPAGGQGAEEPAGGQPLQCAAFVAVCRAVSR